ncbi:MAG TPA: hypothetical protein VE913_15025 [Longimicrobium sp.]|nr:hypothetical protein [Longimicrobium sp.]
MFKDQLFVAFQANDSSNTLYVTSSTDDTNFPPAVAYPGIQIGSAPAMSEFCGLVRSNVIGA